MRVFASLVGLLVLQVVSATMATGQPAGEAGGGGQVLYLRTEFLPYPESGKDQKLLSYRLCREVPRQAFLIAAREYLHVPTRDESLGELPPANAEVIQLVMFERTTLDGRLCKVRLCKVGEDGDLENAEQVWAKDFPLKFRGVTLHTSFVHDHREAIATEMVEALKVAGVRPGVAPKGPPKEMPPAMEQLLAEPNFFAQYEAVRHAHETIANDGPSAEWYSALARGYAHLALLSKHHWSSQSDVFLARSWLYAEQHRMLVEDMVQRETLRAYAHGLGGNLSHADRLLKRLEPKKDEPTREGLPTGTPDWALPLRAYLDCDRHALSELAGKNESYSPWAHFLWFQQTASYRDPQWSHHAAVEVLKANPMAYGVFHELATWDYQLGTLRFGAYQAPLTFGATAPARVGRIAALPLPLGRKLTRTELAKAVRTNTINDPDPDDSFSAVPKFIATELRSFASQEASHPCSWDVLATLLEEEQFVEVASFMKVSQHGTEVSSAEIVAGVMPLIEGHPYAPYIESYRYNLRADWRPAATLVNLIEVRDPKQSMRQMWHRLGNVRCSDGRPFIEHSQWFAQRQFTFQGMIEFMHSVRMERDSSGVMYSRELRSIAPKSELATRFELRTQEVTPEKLATWETSLREDARGLALLGDIHLEGDRLEEATRCYKKSTAASPNVIASIGLAACYERQGDYDRWEETLKAYLETESLGLEHAQIHDALAWGLIRRGLWMQAEEHAVESAGTWSAWGLKTGWRVTEGLSKWEMSEQMAQACSESYPSTSGYQWYYWCQRNGRGDLESARAIALRYAAQPLSDWQALIDVAAIHQMEGDLERAEEYYRRVAEERLTYGAALSLAQLAREEGNNERMIGYLLRKAVLVKQEDPELKRAVSRAGLAVIDLLREDDFNDDQYAKVETLLGKIPNIDRGTITVFLYHVGAYAAEQGREELAQDCWRRALAIASYDPVYATLSGFELSQRLGTSREEDDIYDEQDIWPSLEAVREADAEWLRQKQADKEAASAG